MLLIKVTGKKGSNIVTHLGVPVGPTLPGGKHYGVATERAVAWANAQYPEAAPFSGEIQPVGIATVLDGGNG